MGRLNAYGRAAFSLQPVEDFAFPSGRRIALHARRERGCADDSRGDVGGEELTYLIQAKLLAPHGADDDLDFQVIA